MGYKRVDPKLFKSHKKNISNFQILSQILPPLSTKFTNGLFDDDKEDFKTSNNVIEIIAKIRMQACKVQNVSKHAETLVRRELRVSVCYGRGCTTFQRSGDLRTTVGRADAVELRDDADGEENCWQAATRQRAAAAVSVIAARAHLPEQLSADRLPLGGSVRVPE